MPRLRDLIPDHIRSLPPYPKGRPWRRGEEVVRLSSNENPLGPPPMAVAAIQGVLQEVNRYPDGAAEELLNELARHLGVGVENLVLGNGSDEVIEMAVKIFVREGDEVIIPAPSFAYYRIASASEGARPVEVPLKDYRIDLHEVICRLTPRTKLIFLNNPNNPTGTIFTRREFRSFLEDLPEGVLLVIDEAYGEYVTSPEYPDYRDYLALERPILVLRTFSKFYGLAGLRVGYGIAKEEIISALEKVHQPFNVNLLGAVGALGALRDEEYQRRSSLVNEEGKRYLSEGLRRLGVSFVPSEANFLLVRIGEGVGELLERLGEARVVVRDMKGYGLEGHLRVSIGLPDENRRFLEVLERWKTSSSP